MSCENDMPPARHLVSLRAGVQIPELIPKRMMENLRLVWGSRRLAGDQNER